MTAWHDSLSKKHQCKKSTKWKNKPQKINGESYRSILEVDVHQMLMLMERGGEIKDIRREQRINLIGRFNYVVDFIVFEIKRSIDIGIEAKGFESERWKAITQVWPGCGPFPLQVWKKNHRGLYLEKEIAGK